MKRVLLAFPVESRIDYLRWIYLTFIVFFLLVAPTIDNNEKEETNVFLSSSLQQSSPSENQPSKDQDESVIVQETIDQTISTIILEEDSVPVPTNVIEEPEQEKSIVLSSSSSSSLNPDATPFPAPIEKTNIEKEQVLSTGDESDDENDSNDTPISTGNFLLIQLDRLLICYFVFEGSSEHPRIPIKEEVIVDTNLMPSTPLVKSWLPIEVTHIETPTRFYIRYIYGPGWNLGNGQTPELIDKKDLPLKNVVLNELTDEMTYVIYSSIDFRSMSILFFCRQCYSKHKRVYPGSSYNEGELVAVKYRSKWHRGRFIQYKSNIDFALVCFHSSFQ